MNTIEAINNRRSCKDFIPNKRVPDEIIQKIAEAGTKAASGMNKQAAKIIIINNPELRDLIAKKNAEILSTTADTFYGAPQIICVVADKSIHTAVYDGSLVLGNMMQAAEELGIGSCWIHRAKEFFEMDEGKKILKAAGLDGDYIGIGNLAIGYPASDKRPAPEIRDNYITWLN